MPRTVTLGRLQTVWRVKPTDKPFLRLTRLRAPPPEPDHTPRLRSVSATGTGRGTGRGGKAAADKLTRPLKPEGPRARFVKYIGDREVSVLATRQHFGMSHANVNGYLRNLWLDHGIGYEKEGGRLRLILPPKSTWQNIWRV